jgi:protein-disulfide isomerase
MWWPAVRVSTTVNRKVSGAALLWLAACAASPPRSVAPPQAAPAPLALSAATPPAPSPPGEADAAWDDSESPVPVSSKDPMWGNRDAPVTVVVYSDFQCPYCSRVEPTLDQVRQTYGPDKVRVIWKNNPLPFHQNAKPAAEAAQGVFVLAGNDAFWKFHDRALKNHSALSDDSYEKWAKDAGVKPADLPAYEAGLASHRWAEKIDKDLSDGRAAGVQGTPAFFVNGVFINGAQPFDTFKKTIDQELDKAKAKLASGTSKTRIYVEMTKENKKNEPAT